MREIQLTQGQVALVDDEDYEWLTAMGSWCVEEQPHTTYACRAIGIHGAASIGAKPTSKHRMHRVIMGVTDPETQVDHRDGDGLNNQRSNLRVATGAQNCQNKGPYRNNRSGYKGVSFHKISGKWQANISIRGARTYLGLFDDRVAAAVAYNEAAVGLHGDFARLNPIPEEGHTNAA